MDDKELNEIRLAEDQPGAPPGYLLDPRDDRSHHFKPFPVREDFWDKDGDPLARGEGEVFDGT